MKMLTGSADQEVDFEIGIWSSDRIQFSVFLLKLKNIEDQIQLVWYFLFNPEDHTNDPFGCRYLFFIFDFFYLIHYLHPISL